VQHQVTINFPPEISVACTSLHRMKTTGAVFGSRGWACNIMWKQIHTTSGSTSPFLRWFASLFRSLACWHSSSKLPSMMYGTLVALSHRIRLFFKSVFSRNNISRNAPVVPNFKRYFQKILNKIFWLAANYAGSTAYVQGQLSTWVYLMHKIYRVSIKSCTH